MNGRSGFSPSEEKTGGVWSGEKAILVSELQEQDIST